MYRFMWNYYFFAVGSDCFVNFARKYFTVKVLQAHCTILVGGLDNNFTWKESTFLPQQSILTITEDNGVVSFESGC